MCLSMPLEAEVSPGFQAVAWTVPQLLRGVLWLLWAEIHCLSEAQRGGV